MRAGEGEVDKVKHGLLLILCVEKLSGENVELWEFFYTIGKPIGQLISLQPLMDLSSIQKVVDKCEKSNFKNTQFLLLLLSS